MWYLNFCISITSPVSIKSCQCYGMKHPSLNISVKPLEVLLLCQLQTDLSIVKSSERLLVSLPYCLPWIRNGTTTTPRFIIQHNTLISILPIMCQKRATFDQTWYGDRTNYEVPNNKHTWLWRLKFLEVKLRMIYLQIATAVIPAM
jgi:hypothetical protein